MFVCLFFVGGFLVVGGEGFQFMARRIRPNNLREKQIVLINEI